MQYLPHWCGAEVDEPARIRTLLSNSALELAMPSSRQNMANIEVLDQVVASQMV